MTIREFLNKAKSEGWALGAFNAGNLEILRAIIQAGQNLQSPLIVETSSGEAKHFGMKNFLAVVENFRQETGLSIFTNFDHGKDLEECQMAIEAGYNLIHFDGSDLPYEENIRITKILVEQAHQKGILVEGELNKIKGESQNYFQEPDELSQESGLTNPQQARDFIKQTGIDILAVSIGNLHGTYLKPIRLDLERLKAIKEEAEKEGRPIFFSLHGGSGTSEEDIRMAISLGVVKINVNTELRLAYRQTLENVLRGSEELAIYKIMPPVIAAVQKVVEEKIGLFRNLKS